MLEKGASPEDCVATFTRITAKSLADSYKRWGPEGGIDEIYLGGGGSYNPNIINYLWQELPRTKIQFLDAIVGRSLIVHNHVESDKAGIIGHIQPGVGL